MTTDQSMPSAQTLTYSGEMTIYNAAANFQRLKAHIDQHLPVEIDCSGVTEIDSSGLQLLLYAQAEADAQGLEFKLTGISETVENVLGLLFLKRTLGVPLTTQADNTAPEAAT